MIRLSSPLLHASLLFTSLSILVCGNSTALFGQNLNATISGSVEDSTGSGVPGADVTLKSTNTGNIAKSTSGPDGLFTFPNQPQGDYELLVSAKGFRDFAQKGISIHLNESVRIPVSLQLGESTQTVEVNENASQLNFETPEVKGSITREEIQTLPLQVSGGQRSAAQFVTLLPGVSTGSGDANAFNARFNGGQLWSDEATLDGVTLEEGLLSQSGTVGIQNDFPISPEAVGEINVLTSNFDVQYGASSAAVIVATTKEGTNQFHGGGYEFHRNSYFNARQFGVAKKPRDLENDYGVYVGGPAKLPFLNSSHHKTYFFVNYEQFRSVGATSKPILTVPTDKMRIGDFSEWPNPVYDPDTTKTNPAYDSTKPVSSGNLPYLRQQFMGCNGATPNVICPSDPRLAGSLAQNWLKLVPHPNRPGTTANWESPTGLASGLNANTNQWDTRADEYVGQNDHFFGTYHYRGSLPFTQHAFPAAIDTNNTRIPNYSHIARLNYDHTFSPTVLNHFAFGYLDLPSQVYNSSDCCVSQVPQIQGVFSHKHQSNLNFDNFSSYGGNADFFTQRPTYVATDTLTFVRGRHTMHFGGEFRNLNYPTSSQANGSGNFYFSNLNTGLVGAPSGNSMASFLLGAVSSASSTFYSLPVFSPTANMVGFFAGDTWKATSKLSVTVGLRWDLYQPSVEKQDRTSFFDPNGANPGAGGRLGRLAFAGKKFGEASYGDRHPERTSYKNFGPRMGIAYAFDPKTVVRAGYGVFFEQAFYPGWNGGIATDGFNETVSFNSSLGGIQPAFLLQNGLPQNFTKPPFISSSFLNGQGAPNYRPLDANHLPYGQQWNLSVEREITKDLSVAAAYVAAKGTRLLSQINPINVLNPSLLSMGNNLNDTFQSGQTSLDGVSIPYAGWVEQMKGCSPTVAQALLPYPQYCGNIRGQNENDGNSTYHSLQVKVEKRFSEGLFLLMAYTFSKSISDADSAQSASDTWGGAGGVISPFEMHRNKGLSTADQPHIFTLSLAYQLPFGTGKRFLNGGRLANAVVGGWELTSIVRASSGTPVYFRSSTCNVPSQFAVGCIPSFLPGKNPYAQSMSNYDPNKPLFDASAFEPASSFNFYYGKGPRISNLRGFGYKNVDFGLNKNFTITERIRVQIRGEAFNAFNLHVFGGVNNDVASPNFGLWGGGVSSPRNIQLGGKITF